jgi:hypothetical protein
VLRVNAEECGMAESAADLAWAMTASKCVRPASFWPLRRLPPSELSTDDRRSLHDAASELAERAGRELFVSTAPEIAQSCLLAVPPDDDPVKFIAAMKGWHREHGSFLTERWFRSALRLFDSLTTAWTDAADAQAMLWPQEAPIPRPPDRPIEVLRWVESKQRSGREELGPLLLDVEAHEAEVLASRCLPLLDAGGEREDAAEDLLLALACWTPAGLSSIHPELLRRGVIYPGVLYRDANTDVAEELVPLVELPEHRNHALVALAWTNSAPAVHHFARWRASPPPWASELFVPPHRYARSAGWCIDGSGDRRDLCVDTAIELVPAVPGHTGVRVATFEPAPARCPWCGDALSTVFDLDLDLEDLKFLVLPKGRLCVRTCERCTAYGHVHTDVDLAGGSRWSPGNVRPSFVADGEWVRVGTSFATGRTRTTTVETLAFAYLGRRSQLGGQPSWDQDDDYPDCLRCGEPMPFLGQIDYADVGELGEGMLYAFFDPRCLTAATAYQQT